MRLVPDFSRKKGTSAVHEADGIANGLGAYRRKRRGIEPRGAIKSGKLSLTTDKSIEPAEMLRVFGEPSRPASRLTVPDEPTPEWLRMASLERENALLQQTIAAQVGTIAALEQANRLLTHDRTAKRRWWPWSKACFVASFVVTMHLLCRALNTGSYKENNMNRNFEWDDEKAAANLKNHGVAFEDAAGVFYDPSHLDRYDGREDYGEDRFLMVGLFGTVELVVIYTLRDDTIRIISARKAESHERQEYWKNR